MDVTTNHVVTLTFLTVLDISAMLPPSPSHLSYPTAGWKQEILRRNAGNFIFFYKLEVFFVLKFAINKKSILSQNARWSLFVCNNQLPDFWKPRLSAYQPFSAAESTTPPPFEPGLNRAFQRFLWWKPQGKPKRIQAAVPSNPWKARISSHNKKTPTDHLDELWMLQKKWIIMNPNL